MRISDWSSDVCSSDLDGYARLLLGAALPIVLRCHGVWRYDTGCASRTDDGDRPGDYRPLRRQRRIRTALALHRAQAGEARSEEHTSELQPLMRISYAVFCLKKTQQKHITPTDNT